MLKLNVGCGPNKLEGYINIDNEEHVNPDLLHDIMGTRFPYEDGAVDEIVFFHCIEHIQKRFHGDLINEFHRILKTGGKLYISYPNFEECIKRWQNNYKAERKFWEATIFGRQCHDSDFHVCAITPDYMAELLLQCGFDGIVSTPEAHEVYNFITYAHKSLHKSVTYESLVSSDIQGLEVEIH